MTHRHEPADLRTGQCTMEKLESNNNNTGIDDLAVNNSQKVKDVVEVVVYASDKLDLRPSKAEEGR